MILKYLLGLILLLDGGILFYQSSQLSISYFEAKLLYGDFSVLQCLVNLSLNIIGHNTIGLRFVMIVFHLMSAILLYLISFRYLKDEKNRLWLLLIFMLLPGVVSSALLVNSAGMIIFGLLLFVYLSEKVSQIWLNILLLLLASMDIGFVYLFLGLSVYYFFYKSKLQFAYVLMLYALNSYLFGFPVDGYPSGHFLEAIGVYAAIFTPVIFIYVFYALYRRYLTKQTDMTWYISSSVLLLSLLLSFRQQVSIEYFAPYVIIALPLAAQSFISSYKVRLKMYRKSYRLAFVISLVLLFANTSVVLLNKNLYYVLDNPKNHFAYDMHIAKELANELHNKGISCVNTSREMQLRLKFYEIQKCEENNLQEIDFECKECANVTVSYNKCVVYRGNVTNLNNL